MPQESVTTRGTRSEAELAAAASDHSVDAICITDRDGRIGYVNAALEELLGYDRNEVLGESVDLFKGGEHDDGFYRSVWETVLEGNVWHGQIVARAKNGTLVQRELTVFPLGNATADDARFVRLFRDYSRNSEQEAQLRQSQKLEAIGQLASGIAHEINTPTQYIGDNLQFLKESFEGITRLIELYTRLTEAVESNAPTTAILKDIKQHVGAIDLEFLVEETPGAVNRSIEGNQRVAEVVRAMKEFAHPGSEEMHPTDINRAIRNTISVSRNEWKYVADIVEQLHPSMPLVPCVPGAFNQVILNIVVNAAHAIGDVVGNGEKLKGIITVSTGFDDEWAEIRISDTGTGIPAELRHRIFNPFFTTKGVGKGTGQGLAIARSAIVEAHGGSLTFESEVGKGTTFVIRLPRRR